MSGDTQKIRPVVFLIVLFLVPNLIFAFVFVLSRYFGSDDFNNDVLILKREGIIIVLNKKEMEKESGQSSMTTIEHDLKQMLKDSKSGELTQKKCDDVECSFTILGTEADRLQQVLSPVLKKLPLTAGYLKMIYDLNKASKQVKADLY